MSGQEQNLRLLIQPNEIVPLKSTPFEAGPKLGKPVQLHKVGCGGGEDHERGQDEVQPFNAVLKHGQVRCDLGESCANRGRCYRLSCFYAQEHADSHEAKADRQEGEVNSIWHKDDIDEHPKALEVQ